MWEHPLRGLMRATIINGKRLSKNRAKLRVKFDGATRTSFIDPSFGVHYYSRERRTKSANYREDEASTF